MLCYVFFILIWGVIALYKNIQSDSVSYTNIFVVTVVSQNHLEISALTSTLTSASALQKFYFAFRSFNFVFQSLLWSKTSLESPFHNIQAFLERTVLPAVWSSYSVENPLTPASEKRNSTMDITLRPLKTRKAAACRSVNFW